MAPIARPHVFGKSAMMKSTIVKRSVTIGGHKTSVSLESEFWVGLRDIAARRHQSLSALLVEIDSARQASNLSSQIRLFVLEQYRVLRDQVAS